MRKAIREIGGLAAGAALTGGAWGALDQLFVAGTAFATTGARMAAVLWSAAFFGTVCGGFVLLVSPLVRGLTGRGRPPVRTGAILTAAGAGALHAIDVANEQLFPRSGFSDPLQTGTDLLLAGVLITAGILLARRLRSGEAASGLAWLGTLALPLFPAGIWLVPALASGGGPRPADGARPNVLLVSIDTVRADHLSAYGYHRETSPNLDRLAKEGLLCFRAFSQSSHSLSSHASMISGLYPHEHGTLSPSVSGARPLPPEVETLAEILRDKGWATGAFVNNPWLGRAFGFTQGFEDYMNGGKVLRQSRFDAELCFAGSILGRILSKAGRQILPEEGIQTVRQAEDWIRRHEDVPFFCFLHLIEPHSPYSPPGRFADMFSEGYEGDLTLDIPTSLAVTRGRRVLTEEELDYAISQYDGEIRYADSELGRVLRLLEELRLADRTVVVVTSDHGEVLRHHRPLFSHHGTYEACTRVPLVFRFPGAEPARIDDVVESVDIAPTILSFLDVAPPEYTLPGNRLWPVPERLEKAYAVLTTNDGREQAVRTREWKYVGDPEGGDHLYRAEEDPTQRTDLAADRPDLVERIRGSLDAWRSTLRRIRTAATVDLSDLDEETRDRLRALGYIR